MKVYCCLLNEWLRVVVFLFFRWLCLIRKKNPKAKKKKVTAARRVIIFIKKVLPLFRLGRSCDYQ